MIEEDEQKALAMVSLFPLVMAWIAELEKRPEDVRSIRLDNNVTRDREREARENDGWQYNKLGPVISVRLIFTDFSLHTKDFEREVWRKQNR